MYKYRQHCLYIALIHSPVECNIGLHLPRWELGESVRLLSLFSVQAETIVAAGKDATRYKVPLQVLVVLTSCLVLLVGDLATLPTTVTSQAWPFFLIKRDSPTSTSTTPCQRTIQSCPIH